MIELYLNRDELETFTTIQYSLDIKLCWLKRYISSETDFDGLEDFLDSYTSDDIEEIIEALDGEGESYVLREEDRFRYYD